MPFALSTYLLKDDRCGAINQLVHHLRLDAIDLHAILEDQNLSGGKVPDEHRLELDLLQAVRLAVIMRIFILAAQLPRFTPQDGLSYEQVLDMALSLEIPEVVSIMRKAFPHDLKGGVPDGNSGFDEQATYRPRGIDDYGRLETEIFKPMEQAYETRARDRHGHFAPLRRLRLSRDTISSTSGRSPARALLRP